MADEKEKMEETAEIKTEEPVFAENDAEKETVVFAPVNTPSRKPVVQGERKGKFPVIPLVTAAAVVCVGLSAAVILMSNANNNAVQVNNDSSVSISAGSSAESAANGDDVQSVYTSSTAEEKKDIPSVTM